ncbi:MAG: hypothetical protein LBD11_07435 [Candidatus Peribacteria bacterium]|nr:hypothetical protein [Candidatus Peribacteria bacterium]
MVVDRSFRGKGGGSVEAPFQVMSEVSADYGQRILNYSKDSTARESRINAVAPGSETPKWVFGASFSPFSDNSWSSLKSSNT